MIKLNLTAHCVELQVWIITIIIIIIRMCINTLVSGLFSRVQIYWNEKVP